MGGQEGGEREGTTHSSPAFPSRPPATAGLGGGERGESFAARLCCLQCPLGSKLGASQGPSFPGPETHLFPCLPAVPHLSTAGLHVPTPIPPALASLPPPGGASRLSPSPLFPSSQAPSWLVTALTKPPKNMTQGLGGVVSPQEHAAWGQTHRSPPSHPGVQTPPPRPRPNPVLFTACWQIAGSSALDWDQSPRCKPGRSEPVQMGWGGREVGGGVDGVGGEFDGESTRQTVRPCPHLSPCP